MAAFAEVEGREFPSDVFEAPKLRWAVIGCGVIANQMAQSLALAGRRLHGVCNRTQAKAEAFAERYGVERVYGSLEELCADDEVDATVFSTLAERVLRTDIPGYPRYLWGCERRRASAVSDSVY